MRLEIVLLNPKYALPALLAAVCLFSSGCSKPSADEMLNEAGGLMMQKNFVSARHRLEELVKTYPDYSLVPDARLLIADCFNYEQKPDDAAAIYKQIAKDFPKTMNSWKANVRLGDMAQEDKRFDEAETYYKAAIEDSTEDGYRLTAMNNLAHNYQTAGQMEKSLETLKTMLASATNPNHKLKIGNELIDQFIKQKKNDEAWAVLMDLYDPKLPADAREGFFSSVNQVAGATDKYQAGFQFFDAVLASATSDESKAQASYFNGLLAAATEPYVATGVAVLKKIHDFFPKTSYGRWAQVDAARVILSATDKIPNAKEQAKGLLDAALGNYDDIINNVTTEWFEPRKAARAWSQLGKMREIRGMYLEDVAELKEASKTVAQIPAKFKSLPQETEMARRWLQVLAAKVHVAETSPEDFWRQVHLARAGKLPQQAAPAEVPAATEVKSTTGEKAAPPEAAKSSP
jgi:tetratricopeptide (TPR) repeat protein